MDKRWKTLVFPILHDLVEILFPLEFIDRLLAVDLITVADHRRLSRDSISDKKISRTLLVSILPRKGPDSFDRFLNVLRETEGQEYVAQKIHEAQKIMESEVKHERQCKHLEELKKEREERRKLEIANIGLRETSEDLKSNTVKWELSKLSEGIFFPSVAEINGMIHVGFQDTMLQFKKGVWEGKSHHLGFSVGSVFECEGKGYVMQGDSMKVELCKKIYEWKSETADLGLLPEIPHENQLLYRSAIGHNGNIYLVGGICKEGRVDCFDINKREWKPIKKMNFRRMSCSLAVIDDKMFVGGGAGAGNSVECFLAKEEKWIVIKPTTNKKCQLSSWNKKLVATGGELERKIVELYDESSGNWLPLPSMNIGRVSHGTCTTSDNTLVVVGGFNPGNIIEYSVECLKL